MNLLNMYQNRLTNLQKKLNPQTLYLFSHPSHVTYLTGFSFLVPTEREAFLLCTSESALLVYASFSPVEKLDHLEYKTGTFPNQLKQHISTFLEKNTNLNTVAYDAHTLFVSELEAIKNSNTQTQLSPFETTLITDLMVIKDAAEQEKIATACQITATVLETVTKQLAIGMTELTVKKVIRTTFEQHGIDELAFPTIVAFGPNSALPHHQPSEMKLAAEMPVLIDIGGKYQGYCGDMTRTFWFGDSPSKQFLKIETIVKTAYQKALETVQQISHSSVTAKMVDNAARTYISNQGYGDNFIHTTGHSLGLEIHEQPSIGWHNPTKLLPGTVITIEPGIYLEESFGYRYENTVLLKNTEVTILTAPKSTT